MELSNFDSKLLKNDGNEIIKINSKANKTVINLWKNNKSRNLIYMSNIGATKKSILIILYH